MSNRFYLRDGRNFIVNPELEASPGQAREEKKVFLLTVNPTDLKSDKGWTVDAIRALATGLVTVTAENKRLSKKDLIESLLAYIESERQALIVASQDILENLEQCGYSADALIEMLARSHGTALVNEIERSILVKGYAPTTIVKTIKPDIVKYINQHYQKEDKGFVISALHRKFKHLNDTIKKEYNAGVAEHSRNRQPVRFALLFNYFQDILENCDQASWKDLSFALAFATGRRCAEVHGVATKFEKAGEYSVIFEGQLKTRDSRELAPYEIPTLVSSDLILKGWEQLKTLGKGDYQPEEVNRKLSKPLSSERPKKLNDVLRDAFRNESGDFTAQYKHMRDVYGAKLLENRPPHMTDNAYLSQYLGHSDWDLTTGNTYQKIMLID